MFLLFHKEECPFCQKVRQFMSDEEISYVSIVTPSGSKSRDILQKLGGKQQVPFLVDVDQGVMMYESGDIIEYLKKNA